MRQLERLGHCTEVEVEIVPLSKVPPNIVQEIVVNHQRNDQKKKSSSRLKCRALTHNNHHNAHAKRVLREKNDRASCTEHSHSCCNNNHKKEAESIELNAINSSPNKSDTETSESSKSVLGTATTSTTTTSFSLNGFNTYLSDQQLRSARMSNTMTVMAPCLRQPITTSTPASDLSMRQFKWHYCCPEREQHRTKLTHDNTTRDAEQTKPGKTSCANEKCQCNSHSLDDAIGAFHSSTSTCCVCLDSSTELSQHHQHRSCNCPSTSSNHHHGGHHHVHQSESCHCSKSVHCCTHRHRNARANCLNNNCQNGHAFGENEEEDSDEEEEEDFSSDDEDEDEDEEEQKCKGEGAESEEDDNESNDDDEDSDEEDENLNCGNSFNMKVIHHNHDSMSDNENEDDDQDDDHAEMDSCLHEVELFTCNVCDRTYRTARNLAKHQVHKRHFGCSICDTVFPTLLSLEQHKHTLEHWSDDESNLSISFNKHHCNRHRNSLLQHNHPVTNSFSNHGYPSDSLHLHNHVHNCDQSDDHHVQTKLSLNDTTITGLLHSKSSPNKNGSYGNFLNNNHNHPIEKQSLSANNNNLLYQKVNQTTVDTRSGALNSKPKSILASSLSSKLMASVFNFSSSNASISTNSESNQAKQGPKQILNSHKRLSRSAEEMESLL